MRGCLGLAGPSKHNSRYRRGPVLESHGSFLQRLAEVSQKVVLASDKASHQRLNYSTILIVPTVSTLLQFMYCC
jgi:hypothetical protein